MICELCNKHKASHWVPLIVVCKKYIRKYGFGGVWEISFTDRIEYAIQEQQNEMPTPDLHKTSNS